MKYPEDTPKWLKTAVESMEEMGQRAILTEEPARACGFNSALIFLKEAITSEAESLEAQRMKALHELTWKVDGEPAS